MPSLPQHARSGIPTDHLVVCAVGHVTGAYNVIGHRCVRTIGHTPQGIHECCAPVRLLINVPRLAQLWFFGKRDRYGRQIGPSGDEAIMQLVWWDFPEVQVAAMLGGAEAADDILRSWGLLPYPRMPNIIAFRSHGQTLSDTGVTKYSWRPSWG